MMKMSLNVHQLIFLLILHTIICQACRFYFIMKLKWLFNLINLVYKMYWFNIEKGKEDTYFQSSFSLIDKESTEIVYILIRSSNSFSLFFCIIIYVFNEALWRTYLKIFEMKK